MSEQTPFPHWSPLQCTWAPKNGWILLLRTLGSSRRILSAHRRPAKRAAIRWSSEWQNSWPNEKLGMVCVLGKDSKSFDLDINTLQSYPLQVRCSTVYAPSISLVFRFDNCHPTGAQRFPSRSLIYLFLVEVKTKDWIIHLDFELDRASVFPAEMSDIQHQILPLIHLPFELDRASVFSAEMSRSPIRCLHLSPRPRCSLLPWSKTLVPNSVWQNHKIFLCHPYWSPRLSGEISYNTSVCWVNKNQHIMFIKKILINHFTSNLPARRDLHPGQEWQTTPSQWYLPPENLFKCLINFCQLAASQQSLPPEKFRCSNV